MHAAYNKKQVIRYLLWTFVPAYVIQIVAAIVYLHVNLTVGQLIIAAMMFVPMLGAKLSGAKLRDMGWNPGIKQNIKPMLIAWLSPLVLTAVGAGLYFLVFPSHFDMSGQFVISAAGEDALKQTEAQGLSYPVMILINVLSSLFYGPFINALPALGEETGWRGFLYPQLKARFGRRKGRLLGGFIWGSWHWPLIWLIGYEYGAAAGNPSGYFGFPFSGMLLFCVITIGWGIMHDWLYEKSGTIWAPALFHGAINAAATLPLLICKADTGSARLLGPASVGMLAGLPFLVVAAVLLWRKTEKSGA
jgi:membrane protease YdiL (CAAX protease family)